MTRRPFVVVGGGVSGIAAALALAEAGAPVELIEKRAELGGRASSFVDRHSGEEMDNGQHVLLGCCTNAIDLLGRIGTADRLDWTDDYTFIEGNGRRHAFAPWRGLPAPMHLLPALLGYRALALGDRLAIVRALLAVALAGRTRLEEFRRLPISVWLDRRGISENARRRFFEPVLLGAVNEDLDRVASWPCFQVFLQGFLPGRQAARLAVARDPLAAILGRPARRRLEALGARVRCRSRMVGASFEGDRIVRVALDDGSTLDCEGLTAAVPQASLGAVLGGERARELAPRDLGRSPITGISLWFDREVLDRPHAALLESPIHWIFRKDVVAERARQMGARQRLALVVSASRPMLDRRHPDLVALALAEVRRHLPAAAEARLVHSVVVTETRATFALTPEVDAARPGPSTSCRNLALAGDWTRSGWPATIEGSIRSGRRAAALLLGLPAETFLTGELRRGLLARPLLARAPDFEPSEN